MKLFDDRRRTSAALDALSTRLHRVEEALGRIERRQVREVFDGNLASAEFRVFSQWGEDGIIQALISHLGVRTKRFVEFGVQNYTESNTRFLLVNDNWSGLVLDGSAGNIEYIRQDPIYWQYNLKADCRFITRENINSILQQNGMTGELGLLSIDIDGNDYWVWKEITCVTPAIVIVEYNARFGADRTATIPYDPAFVRGNAHHSMIYYGASLKALCMLADRKGYSFVGCNSAGNNAFFVRNDLFRAPLRRLSAAEGYVTNQFRESRDATGRLLFLNAEEERRILETLPLVDVTDDLATAG